MPNSRPVPESSLVTGSVLGLRFSALTPEMRDRFGIDQGMQGVVVLAVDPDSDAAKKGLSTGDVIVAVGNKPVHAPADVTVRVKDAQYARRDSVLLLVTGRHGRRSVALMPGKGMNPDD
jgi:serine protease Do